jgi:pantoate--beta-alanine ligase
VEIAVCPIVREPDGLALSSRNTYLNSEERRVATILHRALDAAQREVNTGTRDALQLQASIQKILAGERLARTDYVAIVDADNFEPVARIGVRSVYALLAVFIGKTRLIDNLFIEPAPHSHSLICSL